MSRNADQKSGLAWPSADSIDKAELITLIHSERPDQTRKQVRDHIRYCQKNPQASNPLPDRSSFDNKTAADWIRADFPDLICISGFPTYAKTGYFDNSDPEIVIPPLDELPRAYRQCCKENLRLKYQNRILEEENNRMKLVRRGRPKRS